MVSETQKKSAAGWCRRLFAALSVVMLAACGGEMSAEEGAQASETSSAVGTRMQGVGSTNKVLILAGTVTGGANSPEAKAAKALGYTVDVVNDAVWSSKTAARMTESSGVSALSSA